jgi:hypothetical protein
MAHAFSSLTVIDGSVRHPGTDGAWPRYLSQINQQVDKTRQTSAGEVT